MAFGAGIAAGVEIEVRFWQQRNDVLFFLPEVCVNGESDERPVGVGLEG